MKQFKLLWVAVGATVLLGALAASASAGRLSISAQRFRATYSRLTYSGGVGTIECEVVVEGSMHTRTIVKSPGLLVGYIVSASVTRCGTGSATVLRETLPWHVQYSSFTGTLPNITGITAKAIGVSFMVREPLFGIGCLARSTSASPATGTFNREAGGVLTSVTSGGTFPTTCGIEGTYSGSSISLASPEGTRITVTLI